MCPRSWTAATRVKYKCDIQHLLYVLTIVKNLENNRTEEIILVILATGLIWQVTGVLQMSYSNLPDILTDSQVFAGGSKVHGEPGDHFTKKRASFQSELAFTFATCDWLLW